MPNYDFVCMNCDDTEERNVKIEERDFQFCLSCGHKMNRVWTFEGHVWAPTAGGHK
jgi:putative FmdB family regulatory protein